MNFKQILMWVSGLAVTGMSFFSVYQNYQDVTSVSSLVSAIDKDTTFIILTHPPKNFERVKSFVETHVIDLDHPDTLDVAFRRVKAQVKQPLFPLNTNNERDTSFLVMQVDSSFKMVGDTEGILIGSHLDTAMIEKINLRVVRNNSLVLNNQSCSICQGLNAYGDCFINPKDASQVQLVFYTVPMNTNVRAPHMTYLLPDGELVLSRSRRYYAEDIPRELPIEVAGESLLDIHVFDVDCSILSAYEYESEEDKEKKVGFSAAQIQLVQPGMVWSKSLPIVTLPPQLTPDVITVVK